MGIKKLSTIFNDQNSSYVIKMWKSYLYPQLGMIIIGSVLMVIASSLEAVAVKMLQPVFDELFIAKNKTMLNIVGLQIVAVFLVKGLAVYAQNITMSKVGINVMKNLQGDLFHHILGLDIAFFQKNSSGNMIARLTNDVNIAKDAMLECFTAIIKDSCTVVFMIILMFCKSAEMACVMFFLFPVTFWPLLHYGKKIKKLALSRQAMSGNLLTGLTQTFLGIKIIKSYCLEETEYENLKQKRDEIMRNALRSVKISALLSPLMEFMGGVAIAGTLAYGGYRIMNDQMSTGDFIVFLLAIVAAYKPMKSLARLHAQMQAGMASLERIYTVFNEKPLITDTKEAKKLKINTPRIKVSDLYFSYDKERNTLKNINVTFEPNKTTAIVGASGSGKSTLINLLMRFYDPDKGSIVIDDQNIKDVTLRSLRENIAFVSQDVVMFDDTVKNNIIFGKKKVSDRSVVECAKNAAADGFITELENGYETIVGERGSKLSGGQKQMISIARAMLKDAPILLLDEATSALDSQSEKMVQESLEKLMKNRTTIVIAHRLSTIINADKICVFDHGKIVECGTHKELLAMNGYYAKLYNMQFKNHET